MVSKFLILALILSLAASGYWYFNQSKEAGNKPDDIHFHAGFQVYRDNQPVDFSGLEYMHLDNCSLEDEHEETDESEQAEKAHLHNNISDVVHVHRENATWGDLFINLNYEFSGTVSAYVNDQSVEDFLSYPIREYDSVVIFIGEVDNLEEKLDQKVTREEIEQAELQSETC